MLERSISLSVDQLKCLDELRLMLQDCPLLVVRDDNEFLHKFLCLMDWNVDETFKRIIAYFKFRKENPKYFLFGPIDLLDKLIRGNCKYLLERPDRYGRWVYVIKLAQCVHANNIYEIAQLDDVWLTAIFDDPNATKNGLSVLIDAKDVPLRLVSWITPKHSRVMSQKCELAPIDIKYHLVNSSKAVNMGIKLVFPFLSDDMKKSIHFHNSNWESLHQWIGKEVLPEEYGGSVKHLDLEKLKENMYNNVDQILEGMTYGFVDPEPENWDNNCS